MNTDALVRSSSALSSGFSAIADSVIAGIGEVAPVALGVMGVMLVWRIGAKFFKSVAK